MELGCHSTMGQLPKIYVLYRHKGYWVIQKTETEIKVWWVTPATLINILSFLSFPSLPYTPQFHPVPSLSIPSSYSHPLPSHTLHFILVPSHTLPLIFTPYPPFYSLPCCCVRVTHMVAPTRKLQAWLSRSDGRLSIEKTLHIDTGLSGTSSRGLGIGLLNRHS